MKSCSVSALLALLPLAVAAPIKPLVEAEITTEMSIFARKTPSLTCASGVHIITVNGDGARDGQQGFFDSLSGSIMDAIPGSTQRIMPYDTSSRKRSNRAITGGSKNLLNWIELYHAQCPESKIVILGHSAGATISLNTLCGASAPATSALSPDYSKFILASIMYGDQTFSPAPLHARGTCTASGGKFERSDFHACAAFPIQSYCNADDPDCCSNSSLSKNRRSPVDYSGQYDSSALEFVKQQFYIHA